MIGYRKFIVPVLALMLLASCAVNLFFMYKDWRAEARSVLMFANANAEYLQGNGEKTILYAYQSFIGEGVDSSSAQLIGNAYYCNGDIGSAIINYKISSELTDGGGFKELMLKNIKSLSGGEVSASGLPNCANFKPSLPSHKMGDAN